jgi:very-short-patch-repair endonuclease
MKKNGLITTGFHVPYNPRMKTRARELRRNMTKAERKAWNGLLRKLPFTVLRQKPLDHYIVDFYCPALKLVIEIDGVTHGTDEEKEYDETRTKVLNGYGLKVIRFTNDEVMERFDHVCGEIKKYLPPDSNDSLAPLY